MKESQQDRSSDRRRGIQSIEVGMRILEAMAGHGMPAPLGIIA